MESPTSSSSSFHDSESSYEYDEKTPSISAKAQNQSPRSGTLSAAQTRAGGILPLFYSYSSGAGSPAIFRRVRRSIPFTTAQLSALILIVIILVASSFSVYGRGQVLDHRTSSSAAGKGGSRHPVAKISHPHHDVPPSSVTGHADAHRGHRGPRPKKATSRIQNWLQGILSKFSHKTAQTQNAMDGNVTNPLFSPYLNRNNLTSNLLGINETILSQPPNPNGDRPTIAKVSIFASTEQETDQKTRSYERALHSHARHNTRHGYQMYVGRWQMVPGLWNKHAYLQHVLLQMLTLPINERPQWIMWVDADTVLLNPLLPAEIFLPPPGWDHIHFVGTRDFNAFNNGVFFLRVSGWAIELLSAAKSYPYYHPEEFLVFDEQSAMENVLKLPEFGRHAMVGFPQRWFNAYPHMEMTEDQEEEEESEEEAQKDYEEYKKRIGGYTLKGDDEPAKARKPRAALAKRDEENYDEFEPFQARPGDLLVHFAGDGARNDHMLWFLNQVEQADNKWSVKLSKTTYPKEIQEYWGEMNKLKKEADRKEREMNRNVTSLISRVRSAATVSDTDSKDELQEVNDQLDKEERVMENEDRSHDENTLDEVTKRIHHVCSDILPWAPPQANSSSSLPVTSSMISTSPTTPSRRRKS